VKKSFLFLLLLFIGASGCTRISDTSSSQLNIPSTSPAKVVSDYMDALKRQDFSKTYEFITIGYAGNLDRESYKINWEQGFIKKYNWNLLDYQIMGVRIIGNQAYVYTQLTVEYKPLNSEAKVQKNIEIQYVLSDMEKEWKIAGDNCISNCISAEAFVGKTSNDSTDSN
jgi:hypothetical protein